MAQFEITDIPERGVQTEFYRDLWESVQRAAERRKAVLVEVPDGINPKILARNIRFNGYQRLGKGTVAVSVLDGSRVVVWMKAAQNGRAT